MPETGDLSAEADPKEDWHIRGQLRSVKILARIQAITRGLTVAQWLAMIIRAQEGEK